MFLKWNLIVPKVQHLSICEKVSIATIAVFDATIHWLWPFIRFQIQSHLTIKTLEYNGNGCFEQFRRSENIEPSDPLEFRLMKWSLNDFVEIRNVLYWLLNVCRLFANFSFRLLIHAIKINISNKKVRSNTGPDSKGNNG